MMRKVPKHITLILNETDTIPLLDINSSIVPKDTPEGEASTEDNQLYDYLTKGKGRNRKVSSIGVQTIPVVRKTRHTQPIFYEFADSSTFASNWEMYDTYKEREVDDTWSLEDVEELDAPLEEHRKFELEGHELIEEISLEELKKTKIDKELEKLSKNENYFSACLIVERLLANNYYNEGQKQFKGISLPETLDPPVYNYKLDLLWTFSNQDTKSRCVTAISFNSLSEDLVAIGYGKYYFKDHKLTGVVMLWNIKNPRQPERDYYFRSPVTCLTFSKRHPNYLVIGFYNGDIKIIDVSKNDLKIIREDCSTSFEPAWDLFLLDQDGVEDFIVCFGDGQICKYRISDTHLECVQIMKVDKVEGRLKGLNGLRLFEGNQISSDRHPAAICLSLHEDSSIYFVATNEGVIHRCAAKFCTQHQSMFKAHEGAVNAIKFSPFVKNVFATCGDDFQECFWLEGVDAPLITSRFCMEPVLDLEWSPSHSTIIVSLRGTDILLWDIQRKMYAPQSLTKSPTDSQNTKCKFTNCGRCLLVGDIDGNVHVFSISGLPIPAFYQENLFFQSIKSLLLTNTNLSSKLEKLKLPGWTNQCHDKSQPKKPVLT